MLEEPGLVSVVIPSYNHRSFIGRAIESVLSQTYGQVECIVIDDGSRDDSFAFLQQAFGHRSNVRLSTRANRGAHATINEGLLAARGEFLTILNSDDFYGPKRFERLVAEARRRQGPFFGITALDVVDGNDAPYRIGPRIYYDRICALASGVHDAAALLIGNIAMTTSNFFFSRELLDSVGLFRSLRYSHDWDWALRASERHGLVRLPDPTLYYRAHGNNTISEPDIFAHIAENAFVFAAALRRRGLWSREAAYGVNGLEAMRCLLRNESFLPLPTLYLLASGRNESELEKRLEEGALKQELRLLIEDSGLMLDHLLSADHMQKKFVVAA
jgi:glycosyltransferase involved in cell wall biosynthesis